MTADSGPRIAWHKMHLLVGQVIRDMMLGAAIVWLMHGVSATRAVVGVALLDGLLQLSYVAAVVSYRRRRWERAPKAVRHCNVCRTPDPRIIHLELCEDDARALAQWFDRQRDLKAQRLP